MKSIPISIAVFVRKGTVLVAFEKRSAAFSNAALPLLDSTVRPKISILTNINGSVAGNSFNFVTCFRILMRSQTEETQFFTALYASTLIDGQKNY